MHKRLKIPEHFKKIWIFFLTCFLSAIIISGKSNSNFLSESTSGDSPFSIQHISNENGLPSNVISGIVKDDKGYMWIATSDGLCRWDGFKAEVFKHSEIDSSTLIDNVIPRNGLIWNESEKQLIIGTKEGISIFYPKTGKSVNYFVDPLNPGSVQAPVNVVFIDNENVLWVGTDNGFARFSKETDSFEAFLYREKLPDGLILDPNAINRIFDIKQDNYNSSVLWLATLAGLLKFDKNTRHLSWFYYPEKDYLREINQFTMIVPHPDGQLYLGTWNFDMVVFDTHYEKFTGRYGPTSKEENALTNRISPYAINPDHDVWVSSLQGLGIMNVQTGNINFIQSFKNESSHRFAPELFLRMMKDNFG